MMDFSKEKIFEAREVIRGIMHKIKAWDEKGVDFAIELDNQFKIMSLCGHKGVAHDLHVKEFEALEYAMEALYKLGTEFPKSDNRR